LTEIKGNQTIKKNLTVDGNITDNGLTASKVVFTDASKVLTSTGIGLSTQFIKGDGSLDSSVYLTAEADTLASVCGRGNTTTTNVVLNADNAKAIFGAGSDAEIYYDGTHLRINPDAVGSGDLFIDGGFRVDTNLIYADDTDDRIGFGTNPSASSGKFYFYQLANAGGADNFTLTAEKDITAIPTLPAVNSVINSDLAVSYTGNNSAYMVAMNFSTTDTRTVNGNDTTGVDFIGGMRSSVFRQNSYTLTGGGGTVNRHNLMGGLIGTQDNGAYNIANDTTINNVDIETAYHLTGGMTDEVNFSMNAAGKTLTYNKYVLKHYVNNTPVLTNGTCNINYYGTFMDINFGGSAGFGATCYGHYADVTGHDTNWAYYGVGGDWAAALDNSKFYFGTGLDAMLTFTGTQFQIQSDLITATDSLLLRGGTNGILFNIGASQYASITSAGLILANGTRIDEFSIDGTLAGNSDLAVPTEKAVKTYADTPNKQFCDSTGLVLTMDSCIGIDNVTWTVDCRYLFRGTTKMGTPTNIKVIFEQTVGVNGQDIRIYDLTNAQVICSVANQSGGPKIIDMGALSNLPAAEAIFEVQTKSNTAELTASIINNLNNYW
jgi:hypothetical protein